MTSRKEVETQFVAWNFAGTGSDRLVGGNWRFRRHVLYYQDTPYKRVVPTKVLPIQLVKMAQYDNVLVSPSSLHVKNAQIDYKSWVVPTIGVHSRFEGDELSIYDLHERQRYLMLSELRALLEEKVAPAPAADLEKITGQQILGTVERMKARYFNYGLIFDLRWGEVPPLYKQEIADAIKAKIARYHDPKAVAQRERMHARKVAKQAFGIG